jgi:hypothetical protein
VLVSRCAPPLRRLASPALRAALSPLAATDAARLEPTASALALLAAALARAEGTSTIGTSDGFEDGRLEDADGFCVAPRPAWAPLAAPPAAFSPSSAAEAAPPADVAAREALLAAMHAAGNAASGVGAGGAAPPAHTPPRPFGPLVLLTAPSDPFQISMCHVTAPAARRITLQCVCFFDTCVCFRSFSLCNPAPRLRRVHVAATAAAPPPAALRLRLRLGLSGPLAPWGGAPSLFHAPLVLTPPPAALAAAAAGAPPPPGAPPAWVGTFSCEVQGFGRSAVHARIDLDSADTSADQNGVVAAALRAAPYRIPFTVRP